MLENVSEILKEAGKAIYLFKVEELMVASTRKEDINTYLKDQDAWTSLKDAMEDNYMLVYGVIIDPRHVPYELPKEFQDCYVWVIQDSEANTYGGYRFPDFIEEFGSLTEATDHIEDCFDRELAYDISEFVIIVGHKLEFMLQVCPHNHGIMDYKKIEAGNVQN